MFNYISLKFAPFTSHVSVKGTDKCTPMQLGTARSMLGALCRETAATEAARTRTELMRLAAAAAAGDRAAAVLRLREDGLRLGALGVHRGGPLGRPGIY